jgi:hypothetical protein
MNGLRTAIATSAILLATAGSAVTPPYSPIDQNKVYAQIGKKEFVERSFVRKESILPMDSLVADVSYSLAYSNHPTVNFRLLGYDNHPKLNGVIRETNTFLNNANDMDRVRAYIDDSFVVDIEI